VIWRRARGRTDEGNHGARSSPDPKPQSQTPFRCADLVETLAFQQRGIGRVESEHDPAGQRGSGQERAVGGSAGDRGGRAGGSGGRSLGGVGRCEKQSKGSEGERAEALHGSLWGGSGAGQRFRRALA
jgi:hypothetical protein